MFALSKLHECHLVKTSSKLSVGLIVSILSNFDISLKKFYAIGVRCAISVNPYKLKFSNPPNSSNPTNISDPATPLKSSDLGRTFPYLQNN